MRALGSQRQKRATVSKNFPTPNQTRQQQPQTQLGSNNSSVQSVRGSELKPNKISVSDAIGLISIRLSKLENRLILGAGLSGGDEVMHTNMQLVNKDTIINVVNRLDVIESEFTTILPPIQQEFEEIQSNIQIFEDKLNELNVKLNSTRERYEDESITTSSSIIPHSVEKADSVESAQIHLEIVYDNETPATSTIDDNL